MCLKNIVNGSDNGYMSHMTYKPVLITVKLHLKGLLHTAASRLYIRRYIQDEAKLEISPMYFGRRKIASKWLPIYYMTWLDTTRYLFLSEQVLGSFHHVGIANFFFNRS